MGVACGGAHLEDCVLDGEDGHIEGAATHVKDEDVCLVAALGLPVLLGVKAIGDGGGSGLVHDAVHPEPCDFASILGSLPLGVVEIGGHGDNGILDSTAQERFSCELHLRQDHGRDLLGVELFLHALIKDPDEGLVVLGTIGHHLEGPKLDICLDDGVVEASAHEPLRIEDRVIGVVCDLVLRSIAQ
mmetsp:Transcript_48046/g.103008  ORF Transcript_48046/g.103008 Transcript_48046/m.103008 type:complete len:187 (-) Transcript_48046:198-758(-)